MIESRTKLARLAAATGTQIDTRLIAKPATAEDLEEIDKYWPNADIDTETKKISKDGRKAGFRLDAYWEPFTALIDAHGNPIDGDELLRVAHRAKWEGREVAPITTRINRVLASVKLPTLSTSFINGSYHYALRVKFNDVTPQKPQR